MSQAKQTSQTQIPVSRTVVLFRLAVVALFVALAATIWMTNSWLTQRFTETTRNRADMRLALYSASLLSELQRNSVVPQLLARDADLNTALSDRAFGDTSEKLISYWDEIGIAALTLVDAGGQVVAATDEDKIGHDYGKMPLFLAAVQEGQTVFSVRPTLTGRYNFTYSRPMEGDAKGVIVAEVDLHRFENAWAGISDAVLVTNDTGMIILATEPKWRGLTENSALQRQTPEGAIARAIRLTSDWAALPADAYVSGEAVMRRDLEVPFANWTITSFTTYASIRERVNAFIALEIMGFAILLALGFYVLNRKNALRMAFFKQESEDLRALNARLQREIAERERVQENLAVAEQTIAQSSKLAALGEMSAAISHELNQPLAAMKTYLAGAKLLLRRNRTEEALSSFQRVDGLIERMSAITKQLKSYARKGGEDFRPVDLSISVAATLSMMEPQLRQRLVKISVVEPDDPVHVLGDPLRVEQVLVNLLRNALDATKGVEKPSIEIILAAGDMAIISVRDNGPGIDELDQLFEPFYTTKQPGDGVGLGLAISSGIVSDLGGRLTAHNGEDGGAVFEVQLPILIEEAEAAE
jgi:two-component system, NtrC family, C4-dicarboxylate transport sensor histidine kinase DctB